MRSSRSNRLPALAAPLLLFLCWQPNPLAAQDAAPSRTGDLIMSQSRALAPLGKEVFPDNGFAHRSASATAFMWSVDLPSVGHKANSILARVALLQHEPGGGTNTVIYPDIREQAFYVIARGADSPWGTPRERWDRESWFSPPGTSSTYTR